MMIPTFKKPINHQQIKSDTAIMIEEERQTTRYKNIMKLYKKKHPICQWCLTNGEITNVNEVHHITPVYKKGKTEDANLLSLCFSCHARISKMDEKKQMEIKKESESLEKGNE